MTTKKTNNISFEDALTELESLVITLENGNLPLEEAIKTFERGLHLTKIGQKQLTKAQQLVEILQHEDDNQQLVVFNASNT